MHAVKKNGRCTRGSPGRDHAARLLRHVGSERRCEEGRHKPKVEKLAKIGIVPGQDFDFSKLDNGRGFSTNVGTYGTHCIQRALVTAIGLGANWPQDAIYPTSTGSDRMQKYDGSKKYVMRFQKGLLPSVEGFWSLTMYDKDYVFADNPPNRYTLSPRNKLKPNADGSVTLYLQSESPGKDKESNWLPAPKDDFILMMRLYWPKEKPPTILDGSWKIPAVKEAS